MTKHVYAGFSFAKIVAQSVLWIGHLANLLADLLGWDVPDHVSYTCYRCLVFTRLTYFGTCTTQMLHHNHFSREIYLHNEYTSVGLIIVFE